MSQSTITTPVPEPPIVAKATPNHRIDSFYLKQLKATTEKVYRELNKKREEKSIKEKPLTNIDVSNIETQFPPTMFKQVQEVSDYLWTTILNEGEADIQPYIEEIGNTLYFTRDDFSLTLKEDSALLDITKFSVPLRLKIEETVKEREYQEVILKDITEEDLQVHLIPYNRRKVIESEPESLTAKTAYDRIRKSTEPVKTINSLLDSHLRPRWHLDIATVVTGVRNVASLPVNNQNSYPIIEALSNIYDFGIQVLEQVPAVIISSEERVLSQTKKLNKSELDKHDLEFHRQYGRILEYPPDYINFFCDHVNDFSNTGTYMTETIAYLRQVDSLSGREEMYLTILPYVVPGTEDSIKESIEKGKQYYNTLMKSEIGKYGLNRFLLENGFEEVIREENKVK